MGNIRPVTPVSVGFDEDSTLLPVFLTSDLPELRRVPKDSSSGGPGPTEVSSNEDDITDR